MDSKSLCQNSRRQTSLLRKACCPGRGSILGSNAGSADKAADHVISFSLPIGVVYTFSFNTHKQAADTRNAYTLFLPHPTIKIACGKKIIKTAEGGIDFFK